MKFLLVQYFIVIILFMLLDFTSLNLQPGPSQAGKNAYEDPDSIEVDVVTVRHVPPPIKFHPQPIQGICLKIFLFWYFNNLENLFG